MLLWLALCSLLPRPTLSAPQGCGVHESSSSNVSPLLESLRCQNDYESSVSCSWSGDGDATLWLQADADRYRLQTRPEASGGHRGSAVPCVPYRPTDQHGKVHCRVHTRTWAIGVRHTFFFLDDQTRADCSPAALAFLPLSHHLRARPPGNLSTHGTADGGRRVSWSCPYPPSSALSQGLTYQLSYRPHADHNWTTESVSDTSVTLDKQRLLPGHSYEARVRTRASVGHWSHWGPVVSWQTPQDAGRPPRVHCVLDGDTEVRCSWEMSLERAHFISYQMTCQNQTATPEPCCLNPTVRRLGGTVLKYSCSLAVQDPARLLLKLQPTHSAKTFDASKHILPKPPENLTLKEKDFNWVVEWTKPNTELDLFYEVCHYRTPQQEPPTCENTSALRHIIPGVRLVPSQAYELQVRSLLEPGEGSTIEGFPSEWTEPKKWTSHPATWSITYVAYFLIGVFVAVLFLVFYYAFPACRRRLVLWVDSVPSPGKSQILSEIKSSTSRPIMQREDTSVCKVLHFDAVSTWSSHASLWPMKETDPAPLEPDEGVWHCDNLSSLAENVHSSDTSSMSFSGPYIFCQKSKSSQTSAGVKAAAKEDKACSDEAPSAAQFGEGYVCLPGHAVSRSTQDLVSHSDAKRPETSIQPDPGRATSRDQPPAYTATPFSPWPQGGHTKASGYCFLPLAK